MENTNCNNSVCNNSIISINNKKIKDFYDKNSNINFENINVTSHGVLSYDTKCHLGEGGRRGCSISQKSHVLFEWALKI